MTDADCTDVLKVLTAAHPKVEMPAITANLYRRCLIDLPMEVGRAVCLQAVTTLKFFPTIAELREIAASLYQQADNRPTVEDAWREFHGAVGKYGRDGTPQWSHPAIARAASIIGFRDYCNSDTEAQAVWRAQFRKVYEAQEARERDDIRMLPDVHRAIAALAEAKAVPVIAAESVPVLETGEEDAQW